MIWIGLVLFTICVCISCFSIWKIILLQSFIHTTNGYYRGYEFSLNNCLYAEDYLVEELEKTDKWFQNSWVSCLQFFGWLLAIPLMVGNVDGILQIWVPSLLLGALGFSKIKQNTIDICYLVLRQHQERKILIDIETSDSDKVMQLKFLQGKH